MYDIAVEPTTSDAIKQNLDGIKKISKERILIELLKILSLKNFLTINQSKNLREIFSMIFPEFLYLNRLERLKKAFQYFEVNLDILLAVLLIDQKDSSGEEVIFFNKQVKTQTGFLKIARKYNLPIIPIRNKRINNEHIELTFFEPLHHNNLEIDDNQMMETIHRKIEEWIKSEPSQWFWQHKRFS